MLQKTYSNYIKKKRFEKKKEKLNKFFLKEGVYDEIRQNNQKVEISDFSVSIVSAVYNAENEIDEFIRSVVNQNISFKENFELILVDDGSKDYTYEKCVKWVEAYPDNILYFKKENGGAASARNFGLEKVNKKWVSFIDPDDFVNQEYFENIFNFIKNLEDEPDLIVCKMLIYKPDDYSVSDTHPLTYKFKKGHLLINADECPEYSVQLSASSCLFKNENIKKASLTFPDIKPSFEDGFFVNEYLLHSSRLLAIVPNAHYFYRKKANSNSLVSTSWSQKEKFSDQLFWYKKLLDKSIHINGSICDWVKYVVVYDLMWHFTYLVGNENRISFLTGNEKNVYKEYLHDIFGYIDTSFLSYLNGLGLSEFYCKGIKNYFYKNVNEPALVSIIDYDKRYNLAKFRIFSKENNGELKIFSRGKEIEKKFIKVKKTTFLDELFSYEILGWFFVKGTEFLEFEYNGEKANVKIGRKFRPDLGSGIFARNILRYFREPNVDVSKLERVKKIYREVSRSRFCKKYKNCWLMMDRDTQADDNAEHLYSFLSKKEENIWFVLRKGSHDWNRLKQKGFNLIDYGSINHKLAMLNCEFLISSHADAYILNLMNKKHYGDMLKYKFIFLQHGVTKDDLSSWLNSKPIDLFITATEPEYVSIAGNESPYNFSNKEVALTGFPRHDKLFYKNQENKIYDKKRVIVMPTWRRGLAGETKTLTNAREYNNEFKKSYFFQSWNSLLSSDCMKRLADKGVEIIFFPHANLEYYIPEFNCDHVEVLTHSEVGSIQDLFVSADLMITDYSSVAFEMAFLEKAILYFQFDEHSIYAGEHLYSKGYFDYRSDGFGPVASSLEEVFKTIEYFEDNNFEVSDLYLERMRSAFPYEKGKACERVYQEIVQRRSR